MPGPSTEYVTSGLVAAKSSRAIEVIGSTVDEPEMRSMRIDCAPVSAASASSVPSSPSFDPGSTAIVNQRLKSWLRR